MPDFYIKRNNIKHLIFSIDNKYYKDFKNCGFLILDWTRHVSEEFFSERQCSNCHCLGHTRGHCPTPNTNRCGRCGSPDDHDRSKCKYNCINCLKHNQNNGGKLKTNHYSRGSLCPLRAKLLYNAPLFIDYGGD